MALLPLKSVRASKMWNKRYRYLEEAKAHVVGALTRYRALQYYFVRHNNALLKHQLNILSDT